MEQLLPFSQEAEKACLGCVLVSPDTYVEISSIIGPDDFYVESFRILWNVFTELFDDHRGIDALTVADALENKGVLDSIGGLARITELTAVVPNIINAPSYAKIVRDASVRRQLIAVAGEIARRGYDTTVPVAEQVTESSSLLLGVTVDRSNELVQIGKATFRLYDVVTAMSGEDKPYIGVPTGYKDLDKVLSGLQRADMIVLAARPSVGKTAFVLNIINNIAMRGIPVGMFSLEMSAHQLVTRIVSLHTQIESERLKRGDLQEQEWPKLAEAVEIISRLPIYVDDTPGIHLGDLRAKALRLKMTSGLGLLVIDYMQLMRGLTKYRQSRLELMTDISAGLKALAKELDCPVLAVSQLSRGVESRADKRPVMSDLRESGTIEQDADVILLMSRMGMYDKDVSEGITDIECAKHRNGSTGEVTLYFHRATQRFATVDLKKDNGTTPWWKKAEGKTGELGPFSGILPAAPDDDKVEEIPF